MQHRASRGSVLLGIGIAIIIMGLLAKYLVIPMTSEKLNEVKDLPVLNYAGLSLAQDGDRILVSAIISDQNQTEFEDFVCYEKYEEKKTRQSDGKFKTSWHKVGTISPTFYGEIDGNQVSIKKGYVILSYSNESRSGRYRYKGLVIGQNIGVYGTLIRTGSHSLEIDADAIIPGDAQNIIDHYANTVTVLNYAMYGGIPLGVILLIIGVFRKLKK